MLGLWLFKFVLCRTHSRLREGPGHLKIVLKNRNGPRQEPARGGSPESVEGAEAAAREAHPGIWDATQAWRVQPSLVLGCWGLRASSHTSSPRLRLPAWKKLGLLSLLLASELCTKGGSKESGSYRVPLPVTALLFAFEPQLFPFCPQSKDQTPLRKIKSHKGVLGARVKHEPSGGCCLYVHSKL